MILTSRGRSIALPVGDRRLEADSVIDEIKVGRWCRSLPRSSTFTILSTLRVRLRQRGVRSYHRLMQNY